MNKLYVWKKLNKDTRKYFYEFGVNGTSFHGVAKSWKELLSKKQYYEKLISCKQI